MIVRSGGQELEEDWVDEVLMEKMDVENLLGRFRKLFRRRLRLRSDDVGKDDGDLLVMKRIGLRGVHHGLYLLVDGLRRLVGHCPGMVRDGGRYDRLEQLSGLDFSPLPPSFRKMLMVD